MANYFGRANVSLPNIAAYFSTAADASMKVRTCP
jgi:hypothetical protein